MLNRLSHCLVYCVLFASGCTAVNAQFHIEKAESAIERAKERGADSGALYEWTLAERFMAKAHEEVRQNHFGAAERLADAAASYADQSIIALESQGRDLEIDESSLDTLPDRIGVDLVDEVEVQLDYVDLPPGELPTSADDVITDEEVEALFGRSAVDVMNGEVDEDGNPILRDADGNPIPAAPDGEAAPPNEAGGEATPGDAAPGDAAPDDAAPDEPTTPPAEEAAPGDAQDDGEWQDLEAGGDDL